MNDFGLIISKKRRNKRKIYFVFNSKCFFMRLFLNKHQAPKFDVKIYNYSEHYNYYMENNTFDIEYLIGIFKYKQ